MIDDYASTLRSAMNSQQFLDMTDEQQQIALEEGRSNYLAKHPDVNVDDINSITEFENKQFLQETGRGRSMPIININYPNQDPKWKELSKEEQHEKIEEFKARIPEIAKTSPTQSEDVKFALESSVTELERRVNGQGRSKAGDLGARIMEGFTAGLAEGVGLEGVADSARAYFHENAELDQDFSSQVASGLGDLGSSTALFIGTAFTTKWLGGGAVAASRAATGASLASNSIRRYNETYKKAIAEGLDDGAATDAGISSLPGAAIDVLGDRIIGMKFLPDNTGKALRLGTELEKKAIIKDLIKDESVRSRIFSATGTALSEGVTEAVGDYVSGHGAYLTTGIDDFVPSSEELKKSFQIGALLGGGISLAADTKLGLDYVGDKKGAEVDGVATSYQGKDIRDISEADINRDKLIKPQDQQVVFDLINSGKYSEARKVSERLLTKPLEESSAHTIDVDTVNDEVKPDDDTLEFETRPTDNTEAYSLLTKSVFNTNRVFSDQVSQGELDTANADVESKLLELVPARAAAHSAIDNSLGKDNVTKNTSFKTVLDTVAARWSAEKPQNNINEFYEKININSLDSQTGLQSLSGVFTNPQSETDIGGLMNGMITTMRSTGVMRDILTDEQYSTLKSEVGVADDFTPENDAVLSKKFQEWLAGNESPASSVFEKIKIWTQDLYKGLKKVFKSGPTKLDPVFENLFQVTLTPNEFLQT